MKYFHCTDNKMADVCCVCRETANIPLIALGLKETKDVDFSTPFKVQNQHSHLIKTCVEEERGPVMVFLTLFIVT